MYIVSLPLQYLHAIGSFQGLLLAFMLLLGVKPNTAGRILGIWCFFMALYFSSPLVIIHADIPVIGAFIGWGYFVPASFGAFLYLYCRTAITNSPLRRYDLIHCLPFLACILLNLNFLLTSPTEKLELANSVNREPMVVVITQLIMVLQAFFYLGVSINLILKFKNQANKNLSNFNPNIFIWLWVLLSIYAIVWLLETAGLLLGGHYTLAILSDVLFLCLIYSISLVQWRDPKLFFIDKITSISANNKKAKTETFDQDTRESLLNNIVNYMNDEQPYLNNELTLEGLATSVGLSSHHLSEILNQQANKNFYQFVNEYRVNFVCERILNDKNSKILDLAMSAGFSSKSTFNAVFKQFKGVTPSQYRKQLNNME